MDFDKMDLALDGMEWRERLPFMSAADFTDNEMKEIGDAAAMDQLRASELRTLVILLSDYYRKQP